jgi:hypothetical protein
MTHHYNTHCYKLRNIISAFLQYGILNLPEDESESVSLLESNIMCTF